MAPDGEERFHLFFDPHFFHHAEPINKNFAIQVIYFMLEGSSQKPSGLDLKGDSFFIVG